MRTVLRRALERQALQRNRLVSAWKRLGHPDDGLWTEYLRRHGGFRHIGRDTLILPSTVVTDPDLTSIGDNVVLSACILIGHDASASVMERVEREPLDVAGYILIDDHVFIGHTAIVLPNVRIGPKAIVAAGAVVTSDVAPGTVVAGSPARQITTWDELVERRKRQTAGLPWADRLQAVQPGRNRDAELRRLRADHLFEIATRASSPV